VTGAVDDLAGLSQQTTAEATTVASTAEEQAATLSEVSAQARDLTERARDLRRMTQGFEVAADAEVENDGSEFTFDAADAEDPDAGGVGSGVEGGDATGGAVSADGGVTRGSTTDGAVDIPTGLDTKASESGDLDARNGSTEE